MDNIWDRKSVDDHAEPTKSRTVEKCVNFIWAVNNRATISPRNLTCVTHSTMENVQKTYRMLTNM